MTAKNDPDNRLVQKARAGNSLAFAKLVEKYQNKILRLVYDFTGDYQQSMDIAQEVFLKVFMKISTFEGTSQFATWLYRVAVNTCLDELRKSKKKSFRLFADLRLSDEMMLTDTAENADAPPMDIALTKLSEQQRTAIILRYYNELTVEDIAQIMECGANTVRTHIYRGIEKLRKLANKK
jgi:RNA polymerase sigma-70 factor (ECF subfamily)